MCKKGRLNVSGKAGISEITKRYAKAFIELSDDQKKQKQITTDMADLVAMVAESADLQNLCSNRKLSIADQQAVIAILSKKAKFDSLTVNFLNVIAENKRFDLLPEITAQVQDMIAERNGELSAEVTSASTLAKTQVKKIEDALAKSFGSKVTLVQKEEPEIIGGLIVKVGSTMIDNSVRTKLQRLQRAMKQQSATSDETQMKEVA